MSKNLEDDSYDSEVYLQRARDRKAVEEEALTSRATSRKLLSARDKSLDLDKNAGKRSYVSVEMVGDREVKRGAGFHCEVCQYTCQDSQSYMAHLASRYHLTNSGFDMRVARASIDQVKDRFRKHSKKRSTPAEALVSKIEQSNSSSSSGGGGDVPVRAPSLKRQKTSTEDSDGPAPKTDSKVVDKEVDEKSTEKSTEAPENNKKITETGEETEEEKFARLMGFSSFQ